MPWAREIFEMIADGSSIYEVVQHLIKAEAPSPGGGGWYRSAIRPIIFNEVYTGVHYFGKKVSTTTVSEVVNGERIYKKKVVKEDRSRGDWIAIPVPDSGIPPETIARAQESIEENVRAVSKNSGRTWELSGGVGVCSECGGRLTAYSVSNSNQKKYFY